MQDTFSNEFGGITSVMVSVSLPHNILIIGGADGILRLYDYRENKIISTHQGKYSKYY